MNEDFNIDDFDSFLDQNNYPDEERTSQRKETDDKRTSQRKETDDKRTKEIREKYAYSYQG